MVNLVSIETPTKEYCALILLDVDPLVHTGHILNLVKEFGNMSRISCYVAHNTHKRYAVFYDKKAHVMAAVMKVRDKIFGGLNVHIAAVFGASAGNLEYEVKKMCSGEEIARIVFYDP